MKITAFRVVLAIVAAVLLLMGLFVYQLFLAEVPIEVSKQTTVITEPLADDGLPDFATYLLDDMRESVTPDSNGAIPFLEAMWPAGLGADEQRAVANEIGMDLPASDGMTEPYQDPALVDALVAYYTEADEPADDQDDAAADDDESDGQAVVDPQMGDAWGEFDEFGLKAELSLDEWVEMELLDHFADYPWTAEQAPPLAEWLEQHQEHFALLHEAAAREKFYAPSPTLLDDPKASLAMADLSQLQTLRSAVRLLKLRANYYLGEGNAAAAWRDCRAIYDLAERAGGRFLVGDLVAIACESLANEATLRLLDSPHLTRPVAEEIHTFLESRRPIVDIVTTIDRWERLVMVTCILEWSGKQTSAEPLVDEFPDKVLSNVSIDWNIVLEVGNKWYDRVVETSSRPTFAERMAALEAVETELDQLPDTYASRVLGIALNRTERSRVVGELALLMTLPATAAALEAEGRHSTALQLHRTAAALALYRLDEGEYPASLEAIVPEYLPQVPVDLFQTKALVYHKTDAGYLLYSTGGNGQDDGGSNEFLGRYRGYQLPRDDDEAENAAVAELLGEPAVMEEPGQEGEIRWLEEQIPADADDHAVGLPLPRLAVPEYEGD